VVSGGVSAGRFSEDLVRRGGPDEHHSFYPTPEGWRELPGLHGVHPEAGRRIDLQRLSRFELERLPANDGIYCFHARSPEVAGDERIFVLADLRSRSPDDGREADLHLAAFEHSFHEATRWLRSILAARDPKRRLQWNRIGIYVAPEIFLDPEVATRLARRLAPDTRHLGLEKVVVRLCLLDRGVPTKPGRETEIVISDVTGSNMTIEWRDPKSEPLSPRSEYERKVVEARRRRLVYPYEIVRMLTGGGRATVGESTVKLPRGGFEEYDLDPSAGTPRARCVDGRPYGKNSAAVVFGVIATPTEKVPEGMRRVLVLSDPTLGMGALAAPECDRVVAALDLAAELGAPLEWVAVSAGARIAMDSGTENLDATARVVRRIVRFTQEGGTIHVIVPGVNVGAQSYFDALATMLVHTRGALIMTPGGSMVLTGRAALDASGSVSAEDELAIGGLERVMGPNGEAQYYAKDLADAYRILYEHYRYTYVVPGEPGPRRQDASDPADRAFGDDPCAPGSGFASVSEIFDARTNPGRKRPFPMRSVMEALIDRDGGHLERWRAWVGAETAIVWDAHLGGWPVTLIGIESQSVAREGYHPADGPSAWTGGTLFPQSSKKLARALNAASGNRPAVILANLTGFDGSPESMRKLQLEYGAEIARAVVNFEGPILFLVVSRYHGGAYVVFSRALNPRLRAAALEGSFASVIGGGPAAAVVFGREVRARAAADPRVRQLHDRRDADDAARARYERVFGEVLLEKQAELAEAFDSVHTVGRARQVGSLEAIVEPAHMRSYLIERLEEEAQRSTPSISPRSR
jgi:acetyl-CoA carboxylase carboxyltransferase component